MNHAYHCLWQSELLSVCVCVFVYQFLVVNFILSALSVLRLHPHLRNSFHLLSSHWQGKEKYHVLWMVTVRHYLFPTQLIYWVESHSLA